MILNMFEKLTIPNTLAAGPGPGNTDPRVLEQFSKAGLADHMHPDVLRGMKECKFMLREVWGTRNTYTFGVAGTGWSGLDAMISAVQPGDKVLAFVSGTLSSGAVVDNPTSNLCRVATLNKTFPFILSKFIWFSIFNRFNNTRIELWLFPHKGFCCLFF